MAMKPQKGVVKKTAVKKSAVKKTAAKKSELKDNRGDFPMTHSQAIKFGKMNMSPKTSTTLFTAPKGTTKMSQKEIDQIQARRVADRKRTLARAKHIIRRDY